MSDGDIILGIDLGTTFSLVAYADDKGPHIIRDSGGEGRVPSVIGFSPDGRVTIGWEARQHAVENPEHTVYSIKRLMGLGIEDVARELPFLPFHVVKGERDSVVIEIDGQKMSPQEISALILRDLRRRAEAHFGHPVNRAVITVPAYFDDSQRQATRDAGRIAGLEVVRIVNEPTAAALAYGIGSKTAHSNDNGHIAVYDLGGGTFDVSILRLTSGVFEVIATHGDTHLGGDDFDRAIVTLVQHEVAREFNVQIDAPATKQALRLLAEEVKIRLSDQPAASLELDLGQGRCYRRTIRREEFVSLIEPFIERSLESCRRALADARLTPADLGQVVLVGGSTRIPMVRRRVEEFFHRTPYTALNPDEVVALGAAVQGQILSGKRDDALLLDVTPLSLGIETMGGAMGKLIMRNTRIPCAATEQFTTFVDGQTNVKINVLQGERELAEDCRSLATFDLRGIPPMPAGIPKVAVQFMIDANGILDVTAKEQRSGVETHVQVIPAHGLTREEVARIEKESVEFARQDMSAHRLIDLRNQVEFDTHKTEQALSRYGHLLAASERESLEATMRALRTMANTSTDAERLYRALDQFGKSTEHLANLAMTESLREGTAEVAKTS